MVITKNEHGAVNIVSEAVGTFFLGLITLVMLIQLIRLYGENRKLLVKLAKTEAEVGQKHDV